MKSSELAQKAINKVRKGKAEQKSTRLDKIKSASGKLKDLAKTVLIIIATAFISSVIFVSCIAILYSNQKKTDAIQNSSQKIVKKSSVRKNMNGEMLYQWTDEKGVLHLSSVPREVAEKERGRKINR